MKAGRNITASEYFLSANWIAIPFSMEKIVALLDLKNPRVVSFEEGWEQVHMNADNALPDSILITSVMNSFRFIIGNQLSYLECSQRFVETLSKGTTDKVFSFGIDVWCAYYFWMYAENGGMKRYYQYVDDEVKEYGDIQDFETRFDNGSEIMIFDLSKEFCLDIDSISLDDFNDQSAILWDFR